MFAAADPEPGQVQRHCFEASNGEPRVIGTESYMGKVSWHYLDRDRWFHILASHNEELSTREKR